MLGDLIRSVFTESNIVTLLPSSIPIVLKVEGGHDGWIVKQPIADELLSKGYRVYLDSITENSDNISVTVHPTQLSVKYGDSFQEGLFSSKKTQRSCTVAFNVEIVEYPSNRMLLHNNFYKTASDTISVSEIAFVEQGNIESARAPYPRGNFIERIAEPLVIIGTVGVAVLLFFTLRN